MATTFSTAIVGSNVHLKFFVLIQGVPFALSEFAGIPSSILGTRTEIVCLGGAGTLKQGESQIDLQSRRMTGGTLAFDAIETPTGQLLSLVQPMKRARTFVSFSCDEIDTTIQMDSTANLSSSGFVYINAETMSYTGKTATSITGVTRGLFSSRATEHRGATDVGHKVFNTVPSWAGRRVYLYAAVIRKDGTTTADLCSQVGVFRMPEAPKYAGDGVWKFEATELCDDIATRRVYVGFREAKVSAVWGGLSAVGKGEPDGCFSVDFSGDDDVFLERYPLTTLPMTAIILRGKLPGYRMTPPSPGVAFIERTMVTRYYGKTSSGTDRWVHASRAAMDNPMNPNSGYSFPYESAKPALIVSGPIGTRILELLTSRIGDGTNGTYDVLPGRTNNDGAVIMRYGANIHSDEIDEASFLSVGLSVPATSWGYMLAEETSVADMLADFCRLTDSFWQIDSSGRLAVKRLRDAIGSATALDSQIKDTVSEVTYDESAVTPVIGLSLNYDVIEEDYMANVRVIDSDLIGKYPTRQDGVKLESRMLSLDTVWPGQLYIQPYARSFSEIEMMVRRWQVSSGRGDLFVTTLQSLDKCTVNLGDMVTISDIQTVDMAGATANGLSGRVVGRRVNWDDGTVFFRVQIIEPSRVIAPAARVTSIAGTTINLESGAITNWADDKTKPARQFAVGWQIIIQNTATATRVMRTIGSIPTDTSIVVTVAPGITADHITVYNRALDTGTDTANALNEFAHADFAYLEPDDAIDGDVSRWR